MPIPLFYITDGAQRRLCNPSIQSCFAYHILLLFLLFLVLVMSELRDLLASTKIDLPVDINDPYDLGLLLRHLRHHSNLLARIGDPNVKQKVLSAMDDGKDNKGTSISNGQTTTLTQLNMS